MKTKFLTALALSAFIIAAPEASCSEEDMTPPETEEAAPILSDEDSLSSELPEPESESQEAEDMLPAE